MIIRGVGRIEPSMQLRILILICLMILTVSGTLNAILTGFGIKRLNLFFLCLSTLLLDMFTLRPIPEINLNIGFITVFVLLLIACIERGEYNNLKFTLSFIGIMAVVVTAQIMIPIPLGLLTGVVGLLAPLVCGANNRPVLPITCVVGSVLLSGFILVLFEAFYHRIPVVAPNADTMFNAALAGALCSGAVSAVVLKFNSHPQVVKT